MKLFKGEVFRYKLSTIKVESKLKTRISVHEWIHCCYNYGDYRALKKNKAKNPLEGNQLIKTNLSRNEMNINERDANFPNVSTQKYRKTKGELFLESQRFFASIEMRYEFAEQNISSKGRRLRTFLQLSPWAKGYSRRTLWQRTFAYPFDHQNFALWANSTQLRQKFSLSKSSWERRWFIPKI